MGRETHAPGKPLGLVFTWMRALFKRVKMVKVLEVVKVIEVKEVEEVKEVQDV